MENQENKQFCPICNVQLGFFSPRYPKAICEKCSENLKDSDGFNVTHYNTGISGGFKSVHDINGTNVEKDDHICFCNGVKCYADEARFGGIVIQMV